MKTNPNPAPQHIPPQELIKENGGPPKTKEEVVQKLQQILDMLGNKTKQADKAEESGNASPAEKKENESDKELLKLLEKLLKGDIKPEELAKLATLLKMNPEDLQKAMGAGTSEDQNKV